MSALPSARVLRRALGVVQQLPPAALAELIEALIERMDSGDEPDLEEDGDCCDAEDAPLRHDLGLGEADDAEPEADFGAEEDEGVMTLFYRPEPDPLPCGPVFRPWSAERA